MGSSILQETHSVEHILDTGLGWNLHWTVDTSGSGVLFDLDDWESEGVKFLIGSGGGEFLIAPSNLVPMTMRVRDTPGSSSHVVPRGGSIQINETEGTSNLASGLGSLNNILALSSLVDFSVPAVFVTRLGTYMLILPGDHDVSLGGLGVVIVVVPLIGSP